MALANKLLDTNQEHGMKTCDNCNRHVAVLVDGAPHGIEGEFCPKCANLSPEATLELWEEIVLNNDLYKNVPYIIEGSTAKCCKYGRQTPNPNDTVTVCPVHGSKSVQRWKYD